jgi:WD40 repeat protein
VATGTHGGTKVKVWEARDGRLEQVLPVEFSSKVCFSPDGQWLVTNGGSYRLWQVGSWRERPLRDAVSGPALAFSPDSRLLALAHPQGSVRLVEPATGREVARLEDPHQDRSVWLCFSADGAQLVSWTDDHHTLHVWDLRAIRRQLKDLDLDWDLPPYPPPSAPRTAPLRVEVDLGAWAPAKQAGPQ